jgi:hypothetical protein
MIWKLNNVYRSSSNSTNYIVLTVVHTIQTLRSSSNGDCNSAHLYVKYFPGQYNSIPLIQYCNTVSNYNIIQFSSFYYWEMYTICKCVLFQWREQLINMNISLVIKTLRHASHLPVVTVNLSYKHRHISVLNTKWATQRKTTNVQSPLLCQVRRMWV